MALCSLCRFYYWGWGGGNLLFENRKQRVHGEPIAPTWVPMTSTIGSFSLLRFSLSIMTGTIILLNLDSMCCIWTLTLVSMIVASSQPEPAAEKMFLFWQKAARLIAVPQFTSRGKQGFWRPVWRRRCILPSLFMLTPVLLHWSQTFSHGRDTSLSLTMGQFA